MRVSTPLIFRQGINAIETQQQRLAKTQQQLASGTRIVSPSDDPAGAKRLLDLQQTLVLNRQFKRNVDAAVTRLSLEESTLGAVTDVLQRARELAIRGNNAGLTDGDRRALGVEVAQRLEELLGLANTKDGNNEYIFAGFSSATKPFSRAPGGVVYNADQGERELLLGPGFKLAIGDPGSRVFQRIPNGNGDFTTLDNPANTGNGLIGSGQVVDRSAFVSDTYTVTFPSASTFEVRDSSAAVVAAGSYTSGVPITFNGQEVSISGGPAAGDSFQLVPSTSQDMFATLSKLANALSSTTINGADLAQVQNALNRALVDIDQALDNVITVRSSVGARLNAADNEGRVLEDFGLQIQTSISAIEDLDLASAIAELNQGTTTLEAAQRSFALVQRLNLFNFL